MFAWYRQRWLELVASIYIYNEHRGYTALDRVLEAVRSRWPDEHAFIVAAGLSFLVSHTIHYAFGRAWIFRCTERKVATGYILFLPNSLVGLGISVSLFAAFVGRHALPRGADRGVSV